MSPTSGDFLLFFAAVLVLHWALPRHAWRNLLLLAASYLFYGWVHPWYALLLGLSTLADFGLLRLIGRRPQRRSLWLALSLLLNLGVLAFFKYYNFFADDLARTLTALGLDASPLLTRILLPAGLSFYTLKKLACVLDASRGLLPATFGLTDFALYVSFFPQILAGPIDRPQKLLPQIQAPRRWSADHFHAAWPLLVMGLFKKFVVADSLKAMVDRAYMVQEPTRILILAATLAFAVQLLADFSAYTDLARGLARLLGFETSENFDRPYLAISPTEFWNRWHITLSNWLRDYVFFPVRRALLRRKQLPAWVAQVLPPLVTMLLCGIWHGAGWTFALWGLYHGLLIAGYQLAGLGGAWKPHGLLRVALAWTVMFGFVLFGWLLFRAPSLAWLGNLLLHAPWTRGVDDLAVSLITVSMTLVYSLPLALHGVLAHRSGRAFEWLRGLYHAAALAAVVVYLNSAPPDFIYFQF